MHKHTSITFTLYQSCRLIYAEVIYFLSLMLQWKSFYFNTNHKLIFSNCMNYDWKVLHSIYLLRIAKLVSQVKIVRKWHYLLHLRCW